MRIPSLPRRWRAPTLAAVVALTACGAGEATTTETPIRAETSTTADVESQESAEAPSTPDSATLSPGEAAERNIPLLQTPEDVWDVEVLSVADGSITTLREAVDGDRPILLWFWAPH